MLCVSLTDVANCMLARTMQRVPAMLLGNFLTPSQGLQYCGFVKKEITLSCILVLKLTDTYSSVAKADNQHAG